jgi:hypothetical protein
VSALQFQRQVERLEAAYLEAVAGNLFRRARVAGQEASGTDYVFGD